VDVVDARDLDQAVSRYRPILLLLLFVAASLFAFGCSSQPTCPAGFHPYKDKCLTKMAILYVGCTEGRGISPTTEISGGVGGTLKVVADASVTLAYKKTEQENTPVALQIVNDCMEIAQSNAPPEDQEQGQAADFLQQWQEQIRNQTPHISLSSSSAKKGADVTVTGSQFLANETVDIYVHASLVAQVPADKNGRFSAVITVPTSAPPPGFATTIVATGESSARSAQAPFHTAP
jgi:hypothetical protein